MANVWKHIDARPSLESVAETLQQTLWAMDGKSGRGLPITLTKYDGTSYALDAQSAETSAGNTFRARSQNTLYGITLNNAGVNIVGAPTFASFTTGAVLFIGPGGLLSQDVASFYFDDTADKLGIGARGTTQPTHELHVFGQAVVESNFTAGGTVRAVGVFAVGSTTGPKFTVEPTNGDVASNGQYLSAVPAITTSKPSFFGQQTWNSATQVFYGFFLSVTDTASTLNSYLADFQTGGVSRLNVRKDGPTAIAGAAITTNAPVLGLSQTWNNATAAFTGLSLSITDTTSTANSYLADWLVGAARKFAVRKDGAVTGASFYLSQVGGTLPSAGTGVALAYDTAARLYAKDFSGTTFQTMVIAANTLYVGLSTGHALSFYGVGGGVARQTANAAATGSSDGLALVNNLRSLLINTGLLA